MSAKTCQLCGKPLGRMRNSDGEFCSQEHRNQFRLRRGMDRLEEANKVASLMRRRENPRQLPNTVLAAAGGMEPRGSSAPVPFPARQFEPRFPASKPALFQVRIAKTAETFCSPLSELTRRSSVSATRHMAPASLPFVARPAASPLLNPTESTKPAAGVARAALTPIPCTAPAVEGERRSSGAALRVTRRPALPRHRIDCEVPGAASLEKKRRPQPLIVTPAISDGGDSKFHPSREFEKRTPLLRPRRRYLPAQGSLAHSRPQTSPRPDARQIPADERPCGIPRAEGVVRLPRFRVAPAVSGARQAAAASLRPAAYDMAVPADSRVCARGWETAVPVSLPPAPRDAFRLSLPGFGNTVSVERPRNAALDPRPAQVRFAPADSDFDYAPINLQGGFGASAGDSPRKALENVEEHFDNGLENWVGDLVDWKLDAAGARPAGLALLRPTLTLSDYEFEFFTRIETRAVTFAFRAANVGNFLKVTIAMVESGRYELRRSAVIGGIEEPAASAPLPGVLRPGAAFTVKARASQNDFSIWLDGELAARWTDGRLPTGGIGFMAPRDDRARVYWVRLSQLDGPNSHAAAHRPVRSIQ